jgi:hypothetical protein
MTEKWYRNKIMPRERPRLCKGCAGAISVGNWCKACYEDLHENPLELSELEPEKDDRSDV